MIETLQSDPVLWDLYVRREEYGAVPSDTYGRFACADSSNTNVLDPRVSRALVEQRGSVTYPAGKRYAICLTHDVDAVTFPAATLFFDSLRAFRNADLKRGSRIPFYNARKCWNPLYNFRETMALERKYGARSTYYFLALRPGDLDFNYRIEDVAEEVHALADGGWEIGLHGGHGSSTNAGQLRAEKARLESVLGRPVQGCRFHYLRVKVPDSWEILADAGFSYDASLGYHDSLGFRNGMCHPFRPFNLSTGREVEIYEVPLVIMDRTIVQRFSDAEAWAMMQGVLDTVAFCGGAATVLFHNYCNGSGHLDLYEKLLRYGEETGAWMTSCADLLAWWRTHEWR